MERFSNRLPWSEIARLYALNRMEELRNTPVHYNIAPLDSILFVRLDQDQQQIVDEGQWSLVPSGFKELPSVTLHNTRIEAATDEPEFQKSFASGLIPTFGAHV